MMTGLFEAGQYGDFIWTGFGVVVICLLVLGIQSRMKFKKLSTEFETLKQARGSRREQKNVTPNNDKGNDNGS